MIQRIVLAVVVMVVVWALLTYLVGPLLLTLAFAPAQIVGAFFAGIGGYLLAVAAGIWFFFKGSLGSL